MRRNKLLVVALLCGLACIFALWPSTSDHADAKASIVRQQLTAFIGLPTVVNSPKNSNGQRKIFGRIIFLSPNQTKPATVSLKSLDGDLIVPAPFQVPPRRGVKGFVFTVKRHSGPITITGSYTDDQGNTKDLAPNTITIIQKGAKIVQVSGKYYMIYGHNQKAPVPSFKRGKRNGAVIGSVSFSSPIGLNERVTGTLELFDSPPSKSLTFTLNSGHEEWVSLEPGSYSIGTTDEPPYTAAATGMVNGQSSNLSAVEAGSDYCFPAVVQVVNTIMPFNSGGHSGTQSHGKPK